MRREATCPECDAQTEFSLCPFRSDDPRKQLAVEKYQCGACEAVLPDHRVFEDVSAPAPP
jgi:hypothetical protein